MEKQSLENERNQELRMRCIDMATRTVGKPVFLEDGSKHHEDLVKVATKIYEFVTSDKD